MKNWKLAAELFRLAINAPEQSDTDPAEYEDQQFDTWHKCATEFLARTNTEKCDAIRKAALASIVTQLESGKTLVPSETAYVTNDGDSWNWIGKISCEGAELCAENIQCQVYATGYNEDDPEHEAIDIVNLNEQSTDCICEIADNLYA